jgi:hypothetical protein
MMYIIYGIFSFRTFGYLCFLQLLSGRVEKIIAEFESVWAAHGSGHHGTAHHGMACSCIFPFPDQSVYFSSLLADPDVDVISTPCRMRSMPSGASGVQTPASTSCVKSRMVRTLGRLRPMGAEQTQAAGSRKVRVHDDKATKAGTYRPR